jgi:hypothetical protein
MVALLSRAMVALSTRAVVALPTMGAPGVVDLERRDP